MRTVQRQQPITVRFPANQNQREVAHLVHLTEILEGTKKALMQNIRNVQRRVQRNKIAKRPVNPRPIKTEMNALLNVSREQKRVRARLAHIMLGIKDNKHRNTFLQSLPPGLRQKGRYAFGLTS